MHILVVLFGKVANKMSLNQLNKTPDPKAPCNNRARMICQLNIIARKDDYSGKQMSHQKANICAQDIKLNK